jgi:hypothetical protein
MDPQWKYYRKGKFLQQICAYFLPRKRGGSKKKWGQRYTFVPTLFFTIFSQKTPSPLSVPAFKNGWISSNQKNT